MGVWPRHIHPRRSSGTSKQLASTRCSATDQQQCPAAVDSLPSCLETNVAILELPNPDAPYGLTKVYVLAVSHVSRESCDHIQQLLHHVRPEVVVLELDKDRVDLLVGEVRTLQSSSAALWQPADTCGVLGTCQAGKMLSSCTRTAFTCWQGGAQGL